MNSPEALPVPPLGLVHLTLSSRFSALPPVFYTRISATPLPDPYLVGASEAAAALIGLRPEDCRTPDFLAAFSGATSLPGSEPLAAVYSGHQFGVWAGQLGDGRALSLGDAPAPAEPRGTLELQLKGAGLTPYSRMGDGRAVLRSSIREFLCSEAMAALGIPTSRALAVIGSDMRVMREMPETTAVVTRMAPSFIRFGSFEHWYYNRRPDELRLLADYVIDQSYPEFQDHPHRYLALLEEICQRTAALVAQWQAVGFMHGVLNTDNMSVLGLTLDYGPFGFMDSYDPGHICNHTDREGRYAYHMQPQICEWNCYALGQALLPLIGDVDKIYDSLAGFKPAFAASMLKHWRAKLGLQLHHENDQALIDRLLSLMAANRTDFPLLFRRLSFVRRDDVTNDAMVKDLFIDRDGIHAWLVEYRRRLSLEAMSDLARKAAMDAVNPKYVLRNYLAQAAIEKAQQKDFSEVSHLLKVLERPFEEQPENERYAALPPDWASTLSISCSS